MNGKYQTYKFYGYSDDTFGEHCVTNIDYDNCADGKPITFQMTDTNTNKSMYITGWYSRYGNGAWGIETAPVDTYNMPDWTMRILFEDYTAVLEIDVPDNADIKIEHIER